MAGGMDLVVLRQLIGNVVIGLTGYTRRQLGEECQRLGLPEPPDEGTKRVRSSATSTSPTSYTTSTDSVPC